MLPSLRKFNQSEIARERLKIINFFAAYGEQATQQAFGADRKTVARWRQRLTNSKGRLAALVPRSTRPKRVRQSTVGRIIKRHHFYFQKQGRIYHDPNSKWAQKSVKKKKHLRIKHSPKPAGYGHILSDTVEKVVDGTRRYFISAIDAKLKFALTLEYPRLNSANMTDFYLRFRQVYPLAIRVWQSDNGQENLKWFDQQLAADGIPHLFIYPRCPQINTFIERHNRTLQEEYLDYHLDEIVDISQGNKLLVDWNLYYNTQRRHHSLNLLSPLNYLISQGRMSQMCWTSTQN